MNAAGRRWAGRELRRRWPTIAALALLVALAGGAAMAALTGARRSVAVVAETMEERRQPDVMSLPNKPGFDWRPVVELPYVESYGLFAATGLCLEESGGLSYRPDALCTQPPVEGGWYDSIWRIEILEGQMPRAPTEVAINSLAQEERGWEVGDRLHVAGIGPGRLDEYWEGRPRGERPWGPTFEVTVTGVFAGEDAWRVISGGVGQPGFVMSRAFIPTHGDSLEYRVQAFLRLGGGESDVRRLGDDIARITGDPAVPIRNVGEAQRRVERGTGIEATALGLFAAALLVAASVLLGQALLRLVRAGGADAPTLRSLGMAPRTLVAALAVPGVLAGVLGGAGAVVTAVAASPAVPIGTARSFDLHDGVKVDAAVLVPGGLAIAALAVVASLGASVLIVRGLRRPSPPLASPTLSRISRLPFPPTMALGVRMAFERRPGGASIPVRPALVGAVVGVLAVVAAFTVREGVVDAFEHPERAGEPWDAAYYPGLSERLIAEDAEIAGAAHVARGIVDLAGLPVPAYGIRPIVTPLEMVVLDGRPPERDDEIAIGPSSAAALGVEVGDTVPAGPNGRRAVSVTGTALLWEEGGHAAYDEGVWATPAGLKRLEPPQIDWKRYFIDLRPGANAAEAEDRLAAAGGVVEEGWLGEEPAGLDNLRTTEDLPALLAGLLALLALGAVGHTLVSTVRRRRRDLAVLRALGLSQRQTRGVLAWQATTVALVGVGFGVPLGLLAGHLIWRWIATSMPLEYVAPGVVLLAAAVVPAAVLLVNLVAAWPARAATRSRPAAVLRSE